jgi:arylsulfatase/uncharacterized sulfatase
VKDCYNFIWLIFYTGKNKHFLQETLVTMKKWFTSLVITSLLIHNSNVLASAINPVQQPNIVVILADDLGYSDVGTYGSEISTPNIDQLALQGLRFSNYRTSASCAPTRAMLLTGVDSHRAGVANIAEALTPEQSHSPFIVAV